MEGCSGAALHTCIALLYDIGTTNYLPLSPSMLWVAVRLWGTGLQNEPPLRDSLCERRKEGEGGTRGWLRKTAERTVPEGQFV